MAITEGEWLAVDSIDGEPVVAVVVVEPTGSERKLPVSLDDAEVMAAAPELASLLDQILEISAPLKCERDREQAQAVFARANALLQRVGF